MHNIKIIFNQLIKKYLEYHEGYNIEEDILNDENFQMIELNMPKQLNGNDCGLATLENIENSILFQEFLNESDREDFYPG